MGSCTNLMQKKDGYETEVSFFHKCSFTFTESKENLKHEKHKAMENFDYQIDSAFCE